jgi:hypothetical protein
MTPAPRRARPRYRIVVTEIRDGQHATIMDETANGFIAAAASFHRGEMEVALGEGGPHNLIAHIALFIKNHYDA